MAREFLDDLPKSAHVLDLGCGYGRISEWAKSRRPDIDFTGVDFTLDFCRLYEEIPNATAVCADVVHLPFAERKFDAIMAVTVLMYLQAEEAENVVTNSLRLLRPGGVLFAVDPGSEYIRIARRIGFSSSSTGGSGFSLAEYKRLSFGLSARMGGMPGFSACLPLAYLMQHSPVALRSILMIAGYLDNALQRMSKITLHRWLRLEVSGSD